MVLFFQIVRIYEITALIDESKIPSRNQEMDLNIIIKS
jgi:hypothetical protein